MKGRIKMTATSKNRYLIKNTILFSISNLGTKLIHFLLVPLYTNILSTTEYGTLDLITVISMVIVPIISLNISEAIMRFSMDKNANKNKILTVGIFVLFLCFLSAIFIFPILNIISVTSKYSVLLILYILSLISSTIFVCYIRGIEKLLDYSIINVCQALCIAILNIIFLIKFKWGIEGYILAYVISYFLTAIACIIRGDVLKTVKKLDFDKKLFQDMIKYSLVLIPNSLMWWIMNSLDRIMITDMINVDANGIYAVSSKIPAILITLTTIFNQAWMFSAVKEKDSNDKNEYTNLIFNFLSTCVITISAFLIVIIKPLLSIYVGKDFFSAWYYAPPLMIGTVFLTLGTFLSNEYTAHKDSAGFLKSSTIGALINLVLNYILITKFGVIGAAIATCISYIAVFTFRVYDTKKYVKISYYNINRLISLIILFIISLLVYINNNYIYIILFILLILLLLINKELWITIIKSIFIKLKKIRVGSERNEK